MRNFQLKALFIFVCLINFQSLFCQSPIDSGATVVYGKNFIFTVETPGNWINDRDFALNIGLRCFFYPAEDSVQEQLTTYMYALGIDKNNQESLEDFLAKDLEKFKTQHPNSEYESNKTVSNSDIVAARHFSFYNLEERYKEEVLYCETDSSFIILTFSSDTEENHNKYLSDFSNFVQSMKYLGDDPTVYNKSD